jgi:phosphohistidine phosphatase SixA
MRWEILLCSAFAAAIPAGGSGQDTAAAIEAARSAGFAIVCRHAITDHSHNEVEPVNYADSLSQRRLSAEGERQSREMGRALRTLGIPIGDVVASPMHRAWRMAELMFGRTTIDSIWHTNGSDYGGTPLEQRRRVLASLPDSGNRIIISHIGTIGSVLPGTADRLEEGDCVVVRPAATRFDVVGIVPWRAWIRAASGGESDPAGHD